MATVRDVVTRAFRALGVFGVTEDPDAAAADYALGAFQSMIDSWATGGMFGRLKDVTDPREIEESTRIQTTGTVTIPTEFPDYDGDANTRQPYDLSVIEVTDDNGRAVWLYNRGSWVNVLAITLDDDAPLAYRGEHGLAMCLAEMVSGPYGEGLNATDTRTAALFKQSLALKMGSTRPDRCQEYF